MLYDVSKTILFETKNCLKMVLKMKVKIGFVLVVLLAIFLSGCIGKGQILETWQTSHASLLIRIDKHQEIGGFMPTLNGAYYVFHSKPADSDQWHEIMTFRHDDSIDIPKNNVHFAGDKITSVFMGWMYAVTTDGGDNWRVSNIWDFLSNGEKCLYRCIEDLKIEASGTGEIKLHIIAGSKDNLKILKTNDFGESWRE
jgi:hypothetical protein